MSSVFILGDDVSSLNPAYETIFSNKVLSKGFDEAVFRGAQVPPEKWLRSFSGCMSQAQSIELYNHYLIWKHSIEENKVSLVLYNRSFPVQPVAVTSDLFRQGINATIGTDVNLVYYGKYDDRCDMYITHKTVVVKADNPREFVLFVFLSAFFCLNRAFQ